MFQLYVGIQTLDLHDLWMNTLTHTLLCLFLSGVTILMFFNTSIVFTIFILEENLFLTWSSKYVQLPGSV